MSLSINRQSIDAFVCSFARSDKDGEAFKIHSTRHTPTRNDSNNHTEEMPSDTPRSITLAEVEQHVTHDDLWLVIDGKVYDVSEYMDDHPGGGEILLNAAGKDGTDDFEDVGHSADARARLKKLEIGVFAGGESVRSSKGKGKKDSAAGSSVGALLLPILVVLLAVIAALLGRKG